MWLPAIGALVGGVGAYFGKKSEVDEFEDSKRKSIAKLMESKYDEGEQLGELRAIDTMTQNQLGSAMNQAGFASRNVTNAPVAQAAMVAPVVAAGLSSKAQRLGEITNYNKQIDTKIAGIESTSMPKAGLSDFIMGGLAGAQAGMSAEYLLSQMNPTKPIGQAPEVPKIETPVTSAGDPMSDIMLPNEGVMTTDPAEIAEYMNNPDIVRALDYGVGDPEALGMPGESSLAPFNEKVKQLIGKSTPNIPITLGTDAMDNIMLPNEDINLVYNPSKMGIINAETVDDNFKKRINEELKEERYRKNNRSFLRTPLGVGAQLGRLFGKEYLEYEQLPALKKLGYYNDK